MGTFPMGSAPGKVLRTLVGVVEEFSDCSDWFEPSADVERKRGRMRSILYAHEGGQGPEQGRLFG